MAKCTARKVGVHLTESASISFKKDPETGFYFKIEQDIRSNHIDHTTKNKGKKRVSESLYRISDINSWDYKFEIQGYDNKQQVLYFKEIK
jgi:hypothetical protein